MSSEHISLDLFTRTAYIPPTGTMYDDGRCIPRHIQLLYTFKHSDFLTLRVMHTIEFKDRIGDSHEYVAIFYSHYNEYVNDHLYIPCQTLSERLETCLRNI